MISNEQRIEIKALLTQDLSYQQIGDKVGVSTATVHRLNNRKVKEHHTLINSVKCPICGSDSTIKHTKEHNQGRKRRRECLECFTRFNTYEFIELESVPRYLRGQVKADELPCTEIKAKHL